MKNNLQLCDNYVNTDTNVLKSIICLYCSAKLSIIPSYSRIMTMDNDAHF